MASPIGSARAWQASSTRASRTRSGIAGARDPSVAKLDGLAQSGYTVYGMLDTDEAYVI